MPARTACSVLILVLLASLLPAQAPPLPDRPVPIAYAPTPLSPAPPPPPSPPAPGTDPGPNGWGPAYELSRGEGFFFDATLALVQPALKNRIGNDVPLPGSGVMLRVPSVDLDFVASPTFEVGYRLADSGGFVAGAYNFLVTEGTGPTTIDGINFATRTRVNINTFDLDYGTTPYEFSPRYTVAWRLGARISDVFFDSRITNGNFLQQASNDFFGSGPHARLELERRIVALPGLSLFGRLDGSVLIGQIKQRFTQETPTGGDAIEVDTLTVRKTQAVPYLQVQAGLSYAPERLPCVKFTTGYQFEQYWSLGQLGLQANGQQSSSRGELWSHGFFLRGQVDF